MNKDMDSLKFVLCYTNEAGNNVWESVFGLRAMQVRVRELAEELKCADDKIYVFDMVTQW